MEGSTRLWERHPAAMRAALARHDGLIEEVAALPLAGPGARLRARGSCDRLDGLDTARAARTEAGRIFERLGVA